MSTIDERIVAMKFNNSQFLNGVKGTLASLSELKKGLNLDASKKGLDELAQSGRNFTLGNLGGAVEGVSGKFMALATIGITALSRITNKAITTGTTLVKSLTVDPIKQGLEEYELQLNSIQTILANTQSKGSTLEDVNAALAELNTYADKTIYNFAEMSRNIGTFTAAGVDLDTSTQAIKGIANLAAVSGSNSQQASTAMYQLSQALSTGTVKLMDWNSVVNAGMGGQVFQDALKETARAHGVGVDEIIKKQGSFRESLSEGWLSAEILTDTLAGFTGDLNAEQLKAMGYNQKQIEGILEMGKTAQDAATKVKTMTQLLDTLKEAAGSGWAQTWQLIFGDFEQARTMWTNVNNVLSGMIDASADARNKIVGDWNKLGGRRVLIDAVAKAFDALMAVVKPIKEAFREIFPPVTGHQLVVMTLALRDFIEGLKIGETTAENLKRTFKGVFAVLDIGWMIIKGLAGVLFDLVGALMEGSGGVLNFTGNIGDFLVNLRNAIKNGEGLTKFFSGLSRVLTGPIKALQAVAGWITAIFSDGMKSEAAVAAMDRLRVRIKPLLAMVDALRAMWKSMGKVFAGVWEFFEPMATAFAEFFSGIGTSIAESAANLDFTQLLDGISVGLLGGLVLMLKKFLSGGINIDLGAGGFLDGITGMFEGVTETLSAMQAQLRADALMKIGIAIGILAASVAVLSLIDPAKLATALGALTGMFLQLNGAMAMLNATVNGPGVAKLPVIAGSMILMAIAVGILTTSVKRLADMDWQSLGKGIAGVTALLLSMSAAVKLMSGARGALVRAGASLILVAVALKILVTAVEDFAEMDWAAMGKGFAGVAATLLALGLFTRLMAVNKGALSSSVGLVILAGALKILVTVVEDFAEMSWETLGRGFAAMAAALLVVAGAVALLPKTLPITAAGLVLVAGALVVMAQALKMMGGMSWEEIGKGLTVLAGSMVILVGALYLMSGAIVGAAALIVVAGALAILTPILITLGNMSWAELGMGLAALAGAFLVLGLAGLALTPVVPTLLGLGVAITLMGVGLAATGVGILALSVGLTALGASAGVAAAAVVAIGGAIIGLIPAAMAALATGIIAMINVFVNSAPEFLRGAVVLFTTILQAIDQVMPTIIKTVTNLIIAMLEAIEKLVPRFIKTATTILMTLLSAIDVVGPRIIRTLANLIVTLVDTIANMVPRFVTAGLNMIIGILNGIADKMDDIVKAGADIIVEFLQGIQDNYPRVVDEGIQTIVTFVQGLADGIRNNQAAMNAAGRDLAGAIADGLTGGLASKVGSAASAAADWARGALNGAKNALGIHSPSKEFEKLGKFVNQGFIKGLKGNADQVQATYDQMKSNLKDFIRASNEQVAKARENLKKLAEARRKDNENLKKQRRILNDDDSSKKQKRNAADRIKQIQRSIKADKAAMNKQRAIIKKAEAERKKANTTLNWMNNYLGDERNRLKKYANEYDKVTEKLKEANKNLDDAKKTRDDYNKSITDSFSSLESISKDTKLEDYVENLRVKIGDTILFASRLQKLRDMGLNDKLYADLLSRGVDALPFIDQVLVGGKASVSELNKLTDQLDKEAGKLGKTASTELYQAGVDMAQGIVNGLKKQEKQLQAQMDRLAKVMVDGVKKRLKIKSPSRVFAEIGKDSAEGIVVGLNKTGDLVEKAAGNVGDSAISGLRESLSGLSAVMTPDMDMHPTIRPVLDLSDVRKGAGTIGGLLTAPSINPNSSYGKAATLAAESRAMQEALAEQMFAAREVTKTEVNYNQYNSSPKPLSTAEIYRNTKNQLSTIKGGLPT